MLGTEVFGSHQTHSILDGIFEKRLRIYKKKKKKKKKKILMSQRRFFCFPELTFCVPETPKRLFWQTL